MEYECNSQQVKWNKFRNPQREEIREWMGGKRRVGRMRGGCERGK